MDEKLKQEYTEYSYLIRGKLLDKITRLEVIIDVYISHYFSNSIIKIEELNSLIITPNVFFRKKVEIIDYLINTYHVEFIKNHKTFLEDFRTIVLKRNILAHYPLKISENDIMEFKKNKSICFAKFKMEMKGKRKKNNIKFELFGEEVFTKQMVDQLINKIDLYSESILNLEIP